MIKSVLFWVPRVLMILAVLFMGIFSLDAFEGDHTLGQKLLGFLMHIIPVLVLAAILVLAWKQELWGGLLIVAASLALMIWFHSFTSNKESLYIMLPFLVSGILFITGYRYKKKSQASKQEMP